jgi:glutamine amidotransferase
VSGVAIIDYGVGNLRSVEKAFHAAGIAAIVSSNESELQRAERLVLPGVGAFRSCMTEITARGFDGLVAERVAEGIPLLGVCVGMQVLFQSSDEFGYTAGLGLLKGTVRRFTGELHVPHVGWNQVETANQSGLMNSVPNDAFFYFVHSYFCVADDEGDVIGWTNDGVKYASVVGRGKISGVQFHPEKSQANGLTLLRNFGTS